MPYKLLGRQEIMDLPARDKKRERVYGVYIEADGGEVLFNRAYEPMLRRKKTRDEYPTKATGWINHVDQHHFYSDLTPENKRDKIASKVMDAFYSDKDLNPFYIRK